MVPSAVSNTFLEADHRLTDSLNESRGSDSLLKCSLALQISPQCGGEPCLGGTVGKEGRR
jgi:hypothetical protein